MPGIQELIVIAVVALLVLGPKRLPEVARSTARFLARLRAETQRSMGELKRAAGDSGMDREIADLGRELRETRDSFRRPWQQAQVRPPTGSARPDGPRHPQSTAPDATASGPPPTDPEAT